MFTPDLPAKVGAPGWTRTSVLAALFLLSMALGGGTGDPLNGSLFDLFGSYRPLFLLMAGYTALAFVAVLFVPAGVGEADTGLDPVPTPATPV
jgi:MFS family permease